MTTAPAVPFHCLRNALSFSWYPHSGYQNARTHTPDINCAEHAASNRLGGSRCYGQPWYTRPVGPLA
eukprot:503804-Rhodomonas_salina.2